MEKEKIPIPYQIILKRFWSNSEFGIKYKGRRILGRHKARTILTHIFRMGHNQVLNLFKEMNEGGWIEKNHKIIIINVDLKDLC